VNGEADRLAFRRALRHRSTDAERALWRALKAKRLAVFKFRRQHPAGRYVLDFYCACARLVVEADGGQHFTVEGKTRDAVRTAYVESEEIAVMRFTDREILLEREHVVEAIWSAVMKRLEARRAREVARR
jgi:very-short-patch-repair endonuclease